MASKRRFESSGEASKEVYEGFNAWSAGISTYSVQTSYAIIAANWAVHQGTSGISGILDNQCAKGSMVLSIGLLGLNLLGTGLMTWFYGRRISYINKNKDQWEKEYIESEKKKSSWPYNRKIEWLELAMRIMKTGMPIGAGGLFIISLFNK